MAARAGHDEAVTKLFVHTQLRPQYQLDFNAKDLLGRTPLHEAAEEGHHYIVYSLLALGDLQPDQVNAMGIHGETPLHLAAAKLSITDARMSSKRTKLRKTIFALLARGADPTIRGRQDDSPLELLAHLEDTDSDLLRKLEEAAGIDQGRAADRSPRER